MYRLAGTSLAFRGSCEPRSLPLSVSSPQRRSSECSCRCTLRRLALRTCRLWRGGSVGLLASGDLTQKKTTLSIVRKALPVSLHRLIARQHLPPFLKNGMFALTPLGGGGDEVANQRLCSVAIKPSDRTPIASMEQRNAEVPSDRGLHVDL